MSVLNRSRFFFFWLAYFRNKAPWDTGISPPELVAVIEGEHKLAPGKALDLGCGTGTNCIYMAQHGWEVSGVDFMARALEKASRKAAAAGVQVKFYKGDVTRLGNLPLRGPFDLLLDLGCFHGLPAQGQAAYAEGVAALSRPGAVFLLYAFTPRMQKGRQIGVTPEQVKAIFAPAFTCEQVEFGKDQISAWYTLRRVEG